MKKLAGVLSLLLICAVVLQLGRFTPVCAEEDGIVLPASAAEFTKDKGVSPENKKAAPKYDKETGMIWNLAKDAVVTYTVPDGVEGCFDVYLTVSKIVAQFTSQPFSFCIAGGDVFSVPIDCQVSADAIAKFSDDGDDCNVGSLTDAGRFLIASGAELKAGDTIQVLCTYGAKAPSLKGPFTPGVGDITLVSAGTPVATGYDWLVPKPEETDPSDPLSGKTILWIGSSETYGACAAGHYSVVDAVEDMHAALVCEKYAINGTTMADLENNSYIARMKYIPKDKAADLVVVCLSTNDASRKLPLGEIGDSFDLQDFDAATVAGAIQTIIAYARDTFGCPVVFFTSTTYELEGYAEMVDLLLRIQEKWGIGVVDMFHDPQMAAVYGTPQYDIWMHDQLHPNRIGYTEWWAPAIDAYLAEFIQK